MDRQKGLSAEEIKQILEFNWDDSEAEAEPEELIDFSVDEASVLNKICEDMTTEDFHNIELEEDTELQCSDLEEIDSTIRNSEKEEHSFSKVDLKKLKWRKKDIQTNDKLWNQPIDNDVVVQTPLEYFKKFFDDNMINKIVEETNLYSVIQSGTSVNVTFKEMEKYLGILLHMGIVKFPEMRMFWQADFKLPLIDAAMTGKRFEKIKQYLHFSSDDKKKGETGYDKLQKIKPILEGFRNNCLKVPTEQHHCIDEQVIPFKGRQHLKQYNPKKPHKWGFKMFTRCGKSGIIYDFAMYIGEGTCPSYGLGISSDIVVHLLKGLPEHQNYQVFFDNWFTSFHLMKILKDKGFIATGTVRSNRLGKVDLDSDANLKMKGRGSYDHRVELHHDIIVVKWYDNKAVQLMSTDYGIEPILSCRRWNQKDKKHIEIPMPNIVQQYNCFMGGVDLADMLCELYRINHRSRKYYMRIFFWVINSAVTNSWLLYRRHCKLMNINDKETLTLIQFQTKIAAGLIYTNTLGPRKRGRPSDASELSPSTSKRRTPSIQLDEMRYDGMGHLPAYKPTQSRCKFCKNGFTTVICTKCNVAICFTPKKNCFSEYQTK